jgi:hypothetical protein
MNSEKLSISLTWGALIAGVGLLLYGFLSTTWVYHASYLWFPLIIAILVFGVSHITKLPSLWIAMAIACLLAVLSNTVWPLLVVALVGISSLLLGGLFLRTVGLSSHTRTEGLLVGVGLYGTAIGLAAHFPVNYPGVYFGALVLPILACRAEVIRCWTDFMSAVRDQRANALPLEATLLDTAIGAFALTYFVVALMPEVGHDALAMHLFIPGHMALRHQWGFDVDTYVWAVMPALGDWIYSLAFLLGGESSARLTNFGFVLVLAWLVREVAQWAGATDRGFRWAALLFLCMPLTFTEGSTLFIESPWAAFIVAGAVSILRVYGTSDKSEANVAIGGILLGFAAASKAVTFPLGPALALPLLLHARHWANAKSISGVGKGVGFFVLFGMVPYATAWHVAKNPVFPFFNKTFQSPHWPSVNFESPLFQQGIGWDTPYRVLFDSGKYLEAFPGAGGAQWLLLLVPAVIWLYSRKNWSALLVILVGILGVSLVFLQTSYLRYAFPALAILCAGLGTAFSEEKGVLRFGFLTAGCCAVLFNAVFLYSGSPWYSSFPINTVFSDTARSAYLQTRLPDRKAVDLVNQLNAEGTPVAFFSNPMAAGLKADVLYANWYNHKFQNDVMTAKTQGDVAAMLAGRDVAYVVVDNNWPQLKTFSVLKDSLPKISEPVLNIGSVSVLRLRNDMRFQSEMLRNPDLTAIEGWGLSGTAKHNPATGSATVSVSSPMAQGVTVRPGRKYMNSVTARCVNKGEKAVGRIQVNWIDTKGQFITTNIRTFDCKDDWQTESQELVAPPNAAAAVVYGASHAEAPIEISSISFKQ